MSEIELLKKENEKLRALLDVAEKALYQIGKHQHDGKRGCVCDILYRTKDKMTIIRKDLRVIS